MDGAEPVREAVLRAGLGRRDALLAYAQALLRDWSRADDVVQEAFVVVLDRWRELDDPRNAFPWMRGIVRLKALEALRRRPARRGEVELAEALAATLDQRLDDAAALDQARRVGALRACVEGLGRQAAALLERVYWRGERLAAVAGALGRSEDAVRNQLFRLRGSLRACVERRLGGERP